MSPGMCIPQTGTEMPAQTTHSQFVNLWPGKGGGEEGASLKKRLSETGIMDVRAMYREREIGGHCWTYSGQRGRWSDGIWSRTKLNIPFPGSFDHRSPTKPCPYRSFRTSAHQPESTLATTHLFSTSGASNTDSPDDCVQGRLHNLPTYVSPGQHCLLAKQLSSSH